MVENKVAKPKILIVDDNDILRVSVIKQLSYIFTKCDFRETRTGEEAIALAKAWRPDVILMDIELPRMNGIEATKRIKELVPETQVVIFTMQNDPVQRDKTIAAGAHAYVLKKHMKSDLIPLLNKLLSKPI
ncbi:MAG: response regulator [Nitrospira sp.]|nr:response regulator [Nitrospira sp.]